MEIQYGAAVVDKNGRMLGTVNHGQETPNTDLLLSPEDVLEETESKLTLRVTLNELGEKLEP